MMNLTSWLEKIKTSHPLLIDYTLDRIKTVATALDLLHHDAPIITVTGTNGKGSVIYAMESILIHSGYKTGVFTSPYLETFNEQIRINGCNVKDADLIASFECIEEALKNISLSEFEYLTLAALRLFKQSKLDVLLLEVGLGGGDDAVAIVKPNVTVITSIAMDHEVFLGDTLDKIAANEAALLAPNKIGIIGDSKIPMPIAHQAQKIKTTLLAINRDFFIHEKKDEWDFKNSTVSYNHLPHPIILVRNAALAIQAILSCHLSLSEKNISEGLKYIAIKGRLHYIKGSPDKLIDVSHNLEAVTQLATYLETVPHKKIHAVFSCFEDKDRVGIITQINPFVSHWFIAPIAHPRTASLEQLLDAFSIAGVSREKITTFEDITEAFKNALKCAQLDDLIVAFGSFYVARAAYSI